MATLKVLIEDLNVIHNRKVIGYKYDQPPRAECAIDSPGPRTPILEPMPGYRFVSPELAHASYQLIARRL